jgi:HAD superfamily hydrolase (TIGR01509 family)
VTEVRGVLLDLYDTLVRTEWPTMRVELQRRLGLGKKELLRAFTLTRPARSVGTYGDVEGDLTAILEAAGVTPEPELVRELAERTAAFLRTGVRPWEDSMPVLRTLRERGIRTAIVSNCDHSTRAVVDGLGLSDEAEAVVLSFEAGVAKPDAGIYQIALERLGVGAGDAVFVDDQIAYCDGAAALGIATALIVRDEAEPAGSASEPGGHRVIRDLRALLDLIERLSRSGA